MSPYVLGPVPIKAADGELKGGHDSIWEWVGLHLTPGHLNSYFDMLSQNLHKFEDILLTLSLPTQPFT